MRVKQVRKKNLKIAVSISGLIGKLSPDIQIFFININIIIPVLYLF